ncbi:MAG: YkgJ family cysteine cluster protein [Candidatus Riflebacteria bacterium]|nr:YkgJ family cysteine cluster protein [Candidatus Riflebacteria bacterium]
MQYLSDINFELLNKLNSLFEKRFNKICENILRASAEQGPFGIALLEALQAELPKTECSNCGSCCNSISFFSIEYHRIIRDLMNRLSSDQLKKMLQDALNIKNRLAETDLESDKENEKRIRCTFRKQESKVCAIHPVRPFPCRFFGLKKADGKRECQYVREIEPWEPKNDEIFSKLQERIALNSESHLVFPDTEEITFFPFEFWLFRYSLGVENALKIYREIIIPSSTPLSKFWESKLSPS